MLQWICHTEITRMSLFLTMKMIHFSFLPRSSISFLSTSTSPTYLNDFLNDLFHFAQFFIYFFFKFFFLTFLSTHQSPSLSTFPFSPCHYCLCVQLTLSWNRFFSFIPVQLWKCIFLLSAAFSPSLQPSSQSPYMANHQDICQREAGICSEPAPS